MAERHSKAKFTPGMPVSNQLKNQHLMWRAGFGPLAEDADQLFHASPHAYVNALFKASSASPQYIDVANSAVKGLLMGVQEADRMNRKTLSADDRKKLREQSRDDIRNLNLSWLAEMINSRQQLREKMAFFWHGHFASRNLNILYQQQLLDIIRRQALGNFGDLLRAVSKSAAMINFLNNNQNRKDHPNENFAREVMELFTLGRGHYSETDVKEAARAFTGWGATISGEFVFRRFQHDGGNKSFLGQSGQLDGDDVLNILLQQKQTARFICRKLYRFFVNETVNETRVEDLADTFYQSQYDISALMRKLLESPWFYDVENIGTRIKSPVELLAGIQRQLPMTLANPEVQLLLQRLLGQVLFYPPNVAGWPGGNNWIDSSSLMLRLRIPQMIYSADAVSLTPKTDDDQMMGRQDSGMQQMGKMGSRFAGATINWKIYEQPLKSIETGALMSTLTNRLLQVPVRASESLLNSYTDTSDRENFIHTATMRIMSMPEYQLC